MKKMEIIETELPGVLLFKPRIYPDERGYFFESWNKNEFLKNKITGDFVQDNQSFSKLGVLRGLHYQKSEFAQSKLVRVVFGKVLDVVVDIRPDSKYFGQWISRELSSENCHALYIPKGFAHGCLTLSENAIFLYKCDNFYHKESEDGIMWNDPDLNIPWPLPFEKIIVSDKDQRLPLLSMIRREECL